MQLRKILLVDDHEAFRHLIHSILANRDGSQTVQQAVDGLEAVQIAEKLQPDLVLLDIGLPKLNGMRAASQILQLAPNAQILFVSQESSSDVVRAALDLGAMGYVQKSCVHDELLPAIEAIVAGERFVSSRLKAREPEEAGPPVAAFEAGSCSVSTAEIPLTIPQENLRSK